MHGFTVKESKQFDYTNRNLTSSNSYTVVAELSITLLLKLYRSLISRNIYIQGNRNEKDKSKYGKCSVEYGTHAING